MQDDRLLDAAAIVAYHDVTLAELRSLFDQMDVDLAAILDRETNITDALGEVQPELEAARARLAELGVVVPGTRLTTDAIDVTDSEEAHPQYEVPLVPAEADLDKLARLAKARLERLGIDVARDPLTQILPGGEIARSLRAYADEHGDVSWDAADWAVVISAGVLATLIDIVVLRTPKKVTLRTGEERTGSPLTMWLNEHSEGIHQRFLKQFERQAKVPYDANSTKATGGAVTMGPRNHRLKSLGHDPLVGFFYGVQDIMQGTGTYVEKGRLVQIPIDQDPVALVEALLIQVRHLLSDVATPAGLPAPLFTLFQLGEGDSPFIRTKAGVEVGATWAEISQYMYLNGYDLRHFLAMGLSPAIVSIVIRGYWHLGNYASGRTSEQRRREHAKLTSMLLMGHAIATSGTLLKTGVLYRLNPLALNYDQFLAMVPATAGWLKDAIERDHRISQALDREWQTLLAESTMAYRQDSGPEG